MSAIIDLAETITIDTQASVVTSTSQAGVFASQRRQPVRYNFDVTTISVQHGTDSYFGIEDEIMDMNYGASTITTKIEVKLNGVDLIRSRGVWSGTPVVKGAAQSGNSINIDGAAINTTNYARKGDYVQFNGFSKVYQLTETASSDASGNVTLKLNGSVPSSDKPADNSAVVFGKNVQFKLALETRPEPTFSGIGQTIYSNARFVEVVE